MSKFTPSKKTAQDFNNGIKYEDGYDDNTGDVVHAESINNVIESQLWTQGLGANAPNITHIADEGVAYAGIELTSNGTPRFNFSYLKGQKGDTGASGIGVPTSGMFWLSVESNGDLYVEYKDGSDPPQFEIDENNNLYYIIGE